MNKLLKKKISILGCGWLGMPLAEALVQAGYRVSGSVTTPEKTVLLSDKNIQPFIINLNEPETFESNLFFFECDVLIIAVPPRCKSGFSYAAQMLNLAAYLKQNPFPGRKIIFISSTGVYKPSQLEIIEASELDFENASELIQAENSIFSIEKPSVTSIIRFAGLFGPNREPGKFMAGKTDLAGAKAPVNMIHLTDCIGIITEIIQQEKWNEIYNACADEHPSREAFYTIAARFLNLPEPQFSSQNDTDFPQKLISNSKLKNDLHYRFIYPDPLTALQVNTVTELPKTRTDA